MNPFPIDDVIAKKYGDYSDREKQTVKNTAKGDSILGAIAGGYSGRVYQGVRNASIGDRMQRASEAAVQQRNKTYTMKPNRKGVYSMPKVRPVKWPKPVQGGAVKGALAGAAVFGAMGARSGMKTVEAARERKAAREAKKAASVSKSIWGVEHNEEISKLSPKEHWNLIKSPDHKGDRKIMRRERLKGQGKGAAIGAGAGAAVGAGLSVATRGRYRMGPSAGFGALGGTVLGQNIGDEVGRRRGFRKGAFPGYEPTAFGARKISKKRTQHSSAGRSFLAGAAPGWHAAIAGKKGQKIRAAATEGGASILGGLPGLALKSPGLTSVGSFAGGYVGNKGNIHAGRLKPLKTKARTAGSGSA